LLETESLRGGNTFYNPTNEQKKNDRKRVIRAAGRGFSERLVEEAL